MVYKSEANKYKEAKIAIENLKSLTEQASSNFISIENVDITSNHIPNSILISDSDGSIKELQDISIEKLEYLDGVTYDASDKLNQYIIEANENKNNYETIYKPYLKDQVTSLVNRKTKDVENDMKKLYLNNLEINNIENSNQLIINNTYNAPVLNINGTLSASDIVFLNGEKIIYDESKSSIIETETVNIKNNGYIPENMVSSIKKYPPAALASSTYAGLRIAVNESTLSNQAYGNGTYYINWSSAADLSSYPSGLFNFAKYSTDGGAWKVGSYNTDGTYKISLESATGIAGYSGEWVKLKLPDKIMLSHIQIHTRPSQFARAPRSYTLLGTNDGQTWKPVIIDGNVSYSSDNLVYESSQTVLQSNNDYFNEFAFVIHKIGSGAGGGLPNFTELEFYGSTFEINYNTVVIDDNSVASNNVIEFISGDENTQKFTMTKNGNIGIGVTDPQVKLDIDGNVIFSGSLNEVSSEHFANIRGTTGNIQQQIDNINNSVFEGSNIAIQLANNLNENMHHYFDFASNNVNQVIANSDIDTSNYILNASNVLVSSKYDKLNFGYGLDYDEVNHKLSISEINNIWSSNFVEGETVLKYKNLNFYPNKIQKITSFVPDGTVQVEYPNNINNTSLSDNKNVTGIEIDSHTFKWSSTRLYENGEQYNTPTHLFNGSTDDEAYMEENYDDLGNYIGTNKLLNDFYGDWISIQFPNYIQLEKVILTKTGSLLGAPKNFEIYGSTDGNNWDLITSVDNITNIDYIEVNTILTHSVNISTTKSFNHFAICVNEIFADANIKYFSLSRLQFFGKEANVEFSDAVFTKEYNNKLDIITGAASNITINDLQPGKIIISDENGKITNSSISLSDLGYLSGVNLPIQQQIDDMNFGQIIQNADVTIENISNMNINFSNYIQNVSNEMVQNVSQKQQDINFGIGLSFDENTHILSVNENEISSLQGQGGNTNNSSNSLVWMENSNYIYTSNIKIFENDITIYNVPVLTEDKFDKNFQKKIEFDPLDFSVDVNNNITTLGLKHNDAWVDQGTYLEYNKVKVYDNKMLIGFDVSDIEAKHPFGPYRVLHSSIDPLQSKYKNYRIYQLDSSKSASDAPELIFDGNTSTEETFTSSAYNTAGDYVGDQYFVAGYNGEWVSFTFPETTFVSSVYIYHKEGSYYNAPIEYKIYGVSDVTREIDVLLHETAANYIANRHISQKITSNKSYKQIVIVFNKIGRDQTELKISNIEFYGTIDKSIKTTTIFKNQKFLYDTTDMLAWYKFDGDLLDSSGQGQDLTLLSGTNEYDNLVTLQGISSLKFNGSTSYSVTPPTGTDPFNSNTITISVWHYSTTGIETFQSILSTRTLSGYDGWSLYIKSSSNSHYLILEYAVSSSSWGGVFSTYSVTPNSIWRHISFTIDENKVAKLYVDGKLMETSTLTNFVVNSSNKLYIGANQGGSVFKLTNGTRLDDLRVYNRALTPDEVFTLAKGNYLYMFDKNYNFVKDTSDMLLWDDQYDNFVQKYPDVNLTATTTASPYTSQNHIVQWSSETADDINYRGHQLFNGDRTDVGWITANNKYYKEGDTIPEGSVVGDAIDTSSYIGDDSDNYGEWVKIELDKAIYLSYVQIYERRISDWSHRNPVFYVIYGSNDGNTWTQLIVNKTVEATYSTDADRVHTSEKVVPTHKYKHFAITVTKTKGGTATADCGFAELEFYGKEYLNNDMLQPLIPSHSSISYDRTIKITENNSIHFNGSSYLQYENPNGDDTYFTPQQMTISLWIYGCTSSSIHQTIASARYTSPNKGWTLYILPTTNSNRLSLWYPISTTLWGELNTSFDITTRPKEWIHIVAIWTQNAVKLYIDGVYHSENSITYNAYGTNNLRIGAGANEYTNPMYYLNNGTKLDDFRLYNRELTAEEIKMLYFSHKFQYIDFDYINDTTDMLAWYKFDGDLLDSSGNGQDLIGGTGTSFVDDSVVGIKSISFPNTANQELTNTIDLSGNKSFTISSWSYRNTNNKNDFIISTPHIIATNRVLHIGYNTSNTFIFAFFGNDLSTEVYPNDIGKWINWVCTYDSVSSIRKIYKNGLLVANDISNGASNFNKNLSIGKYYTYYFDGKLDDLRIYNRALTPDEVKKIYHTTYLPTVEVKLDNRNGSLQTDTLITKNISSLNSDVINIGSNLSIYNNDDEYSLKLQKDLWVDGANIIWTSDERVKKDIHDIDDDIALQKILSIEPKTYKYIDDVNNAKKQDQKIYGFISQQIEEVFPEATSKTSRFIPNIYQECQYISSNNCIVLPYDFDTNKLNVLYNNEANNSSNYVSNKIKLVRNRSLIITNDYIQPNQSTDVITNEPTADSEATATDPDATTTDPDATTTDPEPTTTEPEPTVSQPEPTTTDTEPTATEPETIEHIIVSNDQDDVVYDEMLVDYYLSSNEYGNVLVLKQDIAVPKVFVYGTEVQDLTTIDKSYIYTLNACATQALSRKVDVLENQNTTLQSYVEQLENRIENIKSFFSSNH